MEQLLTPRPHEVCFFVIVCESCTVLWMGDCSFGINGYILAAYPRDSNEPVHLLDGRCDIFALSKQA